MSIPIRNIYFLLSYAWETLDERGVVDAGALTGTNFADLCAHVLLGGTRRLLKEGLEQHYFEETAELSVIRGRIDFSASAVRQSLERGKAVCHFDELTRATKTNRILRTTLRSLSSCDGLDASLRAQLLSLWKRTAEIPEIRIERALFRSPVRPRKPIYDLLLAICEIVYESVAPERRGHGSRFRDFLEDEVRMRSLFQRFVRNFFARERPDLLVKADRLRWAAIPDRVGDEELLPVMETDVTISSKDRLWIIDTKYYAEALKTRHSAPKLVSANLYQMFAYLKNAAETEGGLYMNAEGILLYPLNGPRLDSGFVISGHRIRVCTLDLAADWHDIRDSLLRLLNPSTSAIIA